MIVSTLLATLLLAGDTVIDKFGDRWGGQRRATLVGRILAEDGSPATGARVVFYRRSKGWNPDYARYTDAVVGVDGMLHCDTAPAYWLLGVMIFHPGSCVRAFDLGMLREGETYDLGEVRLVRGGRVRGRVVDGDGQGVPHHEVIVECLHWPDAFPLLPVVTDASGRFVFDALPTGHYELSVTEEGHAGSKPFHLPVGGDVEVELRWARPGGRVEGTVVYPDGTPAAGAYVETESWGAFADERGRFIRWREGTGPVPVTVSHGMFSAAGILDPGHGPARLVVPRGGDLIVDFTAPMDGGTAAIPDIEIVDADGVRVLEDERWTRETNGRLVFRNLDPATPLWMQVWVIGDHTWTEHRQRLEVIRGRTTRAVLPDLTLPEVRRKAVEVHVRGPDGAPLSGISVAAEDTRAVTDGTGTCRLRVHDHYHPDLEPETLTVHVAGSGWAAEDLVVSRRGRSTVTLRPEASLIAEVRDADGRVSEASLTVLRDDDLTVCVCGPADYFEQNRIDVDRNPWWDPPSVSTVRSLRAGPVEWNIFVDGMSFRGTATLEEGKAHRVRLEVPSRYRYGVTVLRGRKPYPHAGVEFHHSEHGEVWAGRTNGEGVAVATLRPRGRYEVIVKDFLSDGERRVERVLDGSGSLQIDLKVPEND